MFGPWYETDHDCCQHMRKDDTWYEMIQCVWLDTTEEDKRNGLHEYVIVKDTIDLRAYDANDMECYISSYGYTMESLKEEYEDTMFDVIAECILEETTMNDAYIVGFANTFEEAKEQIKKYINK